MVIDSFHKSFVMNMQLRQCFSRDKPFRLQKSLILPVFFFYFHKKPKMFKKNPEFQNLASKTKNPKWQPWCAVPTLTILSPVSSEVSDLCEISDLLLFASYFASLSKGTKFGVFTKHFRCVLCKLKPFG